MNRRTTLILDAGLLEALRARARREGRTLTDVVEQAMRQGLAARGARRAPRLHLPSYDLGPFLVDPADAPALAALGTGADREPAGSSRSSRPGPRPRT
jgi:hypothetical protein